jgi:hypothetical protein
MDTTQRRPLLSLSLDDLNAIFAAGDAKLDESLKQQYPVRSWDDIEREFPNEWVAVIVTRTGGGKHIAEARLFAHSPKRGEFMRLVRELEERYGRLHWTHDFTAREIPASAFSDVFQCPS